MRISGNTILITGGSSGLGRGLAEALHAEGNQVIVTGRRQQALDETTAANPGMQSALLDIDDAEAIRAFATRVKLDHPALNVVVHNAGIMRMENILLADPSDAEATVVTNLLGPIRLNAALLPMLLPQPHAAIVMVSSGLAFMPRASAPTYSATKAAIHSYTESLRYQLRDSTVQVIELVPPYLRTGLTGPVQANDPRAMALGDFVVETMQLLKDRPEANEILVERVMAQRKAPTRSDYDDFFKTFNDMLSAAGKSNAATGTAAR